MQTAQVGDIIQRPTRAQRCTPSPWTSTGSERSDAPRSHKGDARQGSSREPRDRLGRRRWTILDSWRCFSHRRGSISSSTGKPRAGSMSTQRPHACSSHSRRRGLAVQACESVTSGFASASTLRTGVVATCRGARSVRSRVAMCLLTRVSSSACRGSSQSPVAGSARSGTSISTSPVSSGLSSSTPSETGLGRTTRSICADEQPLPQARDTLSSLNRTGFFGGA